MIRLSLLLFSILPLSAQDIRTETLGDGVQRWYRTPAEKPWFFGLLEDLYAVTVGGKPPFGKSVAFLVGVGNYRYLHDLPAVASDLEAMREFLLEKGGFDEVLVARDEIVTEALIEKYIYSELSLNPEDRFLFYYTGHGADNQNTLGFMQFSKAEKNTWYGDQVLKLNDIHAWMGVNKAAHQLYLLDCCASGLAISSMGGTDECDSPILNTLSGKGSRAVITAGTGKQKTYAVEGRKKGYSVFSRAFLDAFRTTEAGSCSLITTHDVYSFVYKQMAAFSIKGSPVTPGRWSSADVEHEGTFVFLNTAGKPKFKVSESEALGLQAMGSAVKEGLVEIIPALAGELWIDNIKIGKVDGGVRLRKYLPEGEHHFRIIGTHGKNADVTQHIYWNRRNEVGIGVEYLEDPGILNPDLNPDGSQNTRDSRTPDAKISRPRHKDKKTFKITDDLSITMIYLEKGSFVMGSPSTEIDREDDETQHHVTLGNDFWLGEAEVTQAQWRAVMGENPSQFKGDNKPVEKVSWVNVQEFITRLNKKAGGTLFRLPTEAEWEYACRAETTAAYSFGSEASRLAEYANFCDNSCELSWKDKQQKDGYPNSAPVKSFDPNPWGLYDMHGNVWEWCRDWYASYPKGPVTDPTGPEAGSRRVLRGGCWRYNARHCRSANRFYGVSVMRLNNVGFRLLRTP